MSTVPTEQAQEPHPLLGRLTRFVQATEADEHVAESLAEAVALVDNLVGNQTDEDGTRTWSNTWRDVPPAVRDRAVIEVGADLFHRRQTRMGVTGFADSDLNPLRVTRDPLAAARPILAPYLSGGFA